MSFFSSSTDKIASQNQNQSSTTNPWAEQQPYLMNAFSGAQDAYNQSRATMPQDFVASQNPAVRAFYQNLLQQGGAGNSLTSAGSGAFTSGINGLTNYSPTAFSQVMSDANSAANDPSVQGRIDAATRDARYAADDALRQNNQMSAANGNINSSRAGARDAVIGSRLANTVADTSANIRGDAFNTGLSTALSRANSNDSNQLGALGALLSGGSGAINSGAGLFGLANTGATGVQGGDQASIDNNLARWASLFQPVNSFNGVVGANNWGSQSTSTGASSMQGTETKNPSGMSITSSILGALFG